MTSTVAATLAPQERTPAPANSRAYRLTSIDMVRGLVIVIMALDHVRDFTMAGTEIDPMAHPDIGPGLFFTRWITHFCAPVFVLLAGTSAGLMTARKSRHQLARFLASRGVWLVFIEIFAVSNLTTFSPRGIAQFGGHTVAIMQVIWVIGAGMLALAVLQYLGRRACLVGGVAIMAGHNLLDPFWPAGALLEPRSLWVAVHAQMSYFAGPYQFAFVYPVLPWIGVMLAGFGSSGVFEFTPERRNAVLLRVGIWLIAAFVVLRGMGFYGDPNPWQFQSGGTTATIIDFLNTTKYPPSLLFLLMTLGPAAIFCAFVDRWIGPVKDALVMFGRVPFAFYVGHIFVIHTVAILLGVAQGFDPGQFLTMFLFFPKGYGVGLPGVYALWAVVIAVMYPLCYWVAGIKARRRNWWLSYL